MLEEPPEHVIFVLATTEKHKVLPTIISRCQGFDFRRPGVETLVRKLAEIAESEGIPVEPEALTAIARAGRGSFRDAEGLLDQLSSFAEGPITAAMVRELLGSVGSEALLEATAALHERRAADALRMVDRLSNEGRDLGQFLGELITHLRNLMLLPYAPEVALAEVGAEERSSLEEQARSIPTAEVVRLIEALGDTLGRVKRGGDPKLELELSFLKLARDYSEPSVDNLLRRLEALEVALEGEPSAPRTAPESQGAASAHEGPVAGSAGEEIVPEDPAASEESSPHSDQHESEAASGGVDDAAVSVAILSSRWGQLMEDLKRNRQALTATVFQEGRPFSFEDDVLKIEFPADSDFHAVEARRSRHGDALRDVLEEHFGVRPRLECRVADGSSGRPAPPRGPQPEAPSPEGERDLAPASGAGKERANGPGEVGEDGAGSEAARRPSASAPTGTAPDATGLDDTILSEDEVFQMARERFGSRGPS
jgi:DNA polymerase-3 subunit gamma/tau